MINQTDLVDQVFYIKKKAILKDLKMQGLLGHTVADIHVIEFLKRITAHAYTSIFSRGRQDKESRHY